MIVLQKPRPLVVSVRTRNGNAYRQTRILILEPLYIVARDEYSLTFKTFLKDLRMLIQSHNEVFVERLKKVWRESNA